MHVEGASDIQDRAAGQWVKNRTFVESGEFASASKASLIHSVEALGQVCSVSQEETAERMLAID